MLPKEESPDLCGGGVFSCLLGSVSRLIYRMMQGTISSPRIKCYSTNFTISVPKLEGEGGGGPRKDTRLFLSTKRGEWFSSLSSGLIKEIVQ